MRTTAPAQQATEANLEPATRAAVERPLNPGLRQVADVAGLPRVLLIGDSISIGYTLETRARFKGRANVHHPPVNCGPTDRGIEQLDAWLGDKPWDVIHFNFGLHDLKYLDGNGAYVSPAVGTVLATPERYADNLRAIVRRLRRTNAKLIFATTTPVPPGSLGRIEGGERAYNERAVAVMREFGVSVNDLGKVARDAQARLPPLPPRPAKLDGRTRPGDPQMLYDVHFTQDGYSMLADQVVADIQAALDAKKD